MSDAPHPGGDRLARLLRRLRRSRNRPRVVYSPEYSLKLAWADVDSRRAERILSFLTSVGAVGRRDISRPDQASMLDLRRLHDDGFLEALQQPGGVTSILGFNVSDADQDRFLSVQRAMSGGTLLATRLALDGRTSINLGGGLHHATRNRGQGFCAFNDVALAITVARDSGRARRALVIDLDVHDGEGTRSIFANDDAVHTFSIHNRHLGDVTAVASTSIALGDEVNDAEYLETLRTALPAALDESRPDLVIYIAGTDPARDDRLGNWRITADAMLERDRFVMDLLRDQTDAPATVVVLGGGYGKESWRYSARFLGWLTSGSVIEPPATLSWTLERMRHLARRIPATRLTAESSTEPNFSEADLHPQVGPSRLLGYYSRHGLELALERYGILAYLRGRGFGEPVLEFEPESAPGQTIRIRTGPPDHALIMECRLRRDTRSLEGMELLFVEWLLLQDPSREFTGERPRLPSQSHPGLGLLREVSALFSLICERLGLDGVGFVPQHFHLAALTPDSYRFIEPEDHGRFLALRRDLKASRLTDAASAMETGRVFDTETGEAVTWRPSRMVQPVSQRLRDFFNTAGYREASDRVASRCHFEIRNHT